MSAKTERICPVCGMPIGRHNGKYCSRECYRISMRSRECYRASMQPKTPTKDTQLVDDSYAHAVRAIAALDDGQRETLRMMVEDVW